MQVSAAALLGSAWSCLQEAAVEALPVVDDILELGARGWHQHEGTVIECMAQFLSFVVGSKVPDYGSAWSAESLLFNCRCGQQWRSGAIPLLTAVASSRGAVEAHLFNCCCVQQRRCGAASLLTAVASSSDVAASRLFQLLL